MTANMMKGSMMIQQFEVTNLEETLMMAEARAILDLRQQTRTRTRMAKPKNATAAIILKV